MFWRASIRLRANVEARNLIGNDNIISGGSAEASSLLCEAKQRLT
jgi:hypothetical protein